MACFAGCIDPGHGQASVPTRSRLPFQWKIQAPSNTRFLEDNPSLHSKWHLDRLVRFAGLTDKQTPRSRNIDYWLHLVRPTPMRPKYIILLGYSSRSPYCYRAGSRLESRGVHGDGEDWDPMGPMGFPWDPWE